MAFGNFEFPHSNYYDSDLRELLAMYRKLADEYEHMYQKYLELIALYEKLEKDFYNLKSDVQKQINAITKQLISMQKQIDEFIAEYEQIISMLDALRAAVAGFRRLIDVKIELNNLHIYAMIADATTKLQREIDELWKEIEKKDLTEIFNRLEGRKMLLSDVVQDYYEGLRLHCLTVAEYEALQFSVNDYNAFLLTARQYALYSRDALHYFWRHNAFNPFTTLKNSQDNVNSWIVTAFLRSATIEQYDDLALDADAYEALDLTVLEYNHILEQGGYTVTKDGNGLTVDEYDTLGIYNPPGATIS